MNTKNLKNEVVVFFFFSKKKTSKTMIVSKKKTFSNNNYIYTIYNMKKTKKKTYILPKLNLKTISILLFYIN